MNAVQFKWCVKFSYIFQQSDLLFFYHSQEVKRRHPACIFEKKLYAIKSFWYSAQVLIFRIIKSICKYIARKIFAILHIHYLRCYETLNWCMWIERINGIDLLELHLLLPFNGIFVDEWKQKEEQISILTISIYQKIPTK